MDSLYDNLLAHKQSILCTKSPAFTRYQAKAVKAQRSTWKIEISGL